MADFNVEAANAIAQRRYGLDYQGALRRCMVTSASFADELQNTDPNGIAQTIAAIGHDENFQNANIMFTLAFAPAP